MKCQVCQKSESIKDVTLGILPCKRCQERLRALPKAGQQSEWTSADIKEQRKAHSKEILQPYRAGELSKEYLDEYGTKSIKASEEEIKKASYTWNDDKYYKEHK